MVLYRLYLHFLCRGRAHLWIFVGHLELAERGRVSWPLTCWADVIYAWLRLDARSPPDVVRLSWQYSDCNVVCAHLHKGSEDLNNQVCDSVFAFLLVCLVIVSITALTKYPVPLSSTNTDRLPVHHVLTLGSRNAAMYRRHSLTVCLCLYLSAVLTQ